MGTRLVLLPITRPLTIVKAPEPEAPDFTEADKEWIDKIDRTRLSWDNW